jgi:hypothetical protein
MKQISIVCIILFLALPAARPQTELVRRNFFPAEFEFRELESITSEQTIDDRTGLSGLQHGALFAEAGFRKYSRRVYSIPGGSLSIEIVSFEDAKAAFSLLTLVSGSALVKGPPGDWVARDGGGLAFAQGSFWVRITGDSAGDLLRRVTVSVSNRIGAREPAQVSFVSRFPEEGLVPGSLRYFVGAEAFRTFGKPVAGSPLQFKPEMEVAQAEYSRGDGSGALTVISFPTDEMSEDYLDLISTTREPRTGTRFYSKRAGPILGFVDGNLDPGAADEILGSIQYKYAIKWIFDKNRRGSGTVWGIPMPILGTVVRSLVFTALLCGISLLVGIGFAAFRILLRGYAPNNYFDRPERTEIIRLKIDEN